MKTNIRVLLCTLMLFNIGCHFNDTEKYLNDLENENVMVRNNAIYYLGEHKEKLAVPMLIELLNNDQPKETRLMAIESLGKIGNGSSVDALVSALIEKDNEIRIAAIEALGKIKDPKAVKPLITILNDIDNRDIQIPTIWALGNIGDKNAIPVLTKLLGAQDKDIRYNANQALKKMEESRDRKIAKNVFQEKIPAVDHSEKAQTEVQKTQPVKRKKVSRQAAKAKPEKVEAQRIPERIRTAATKPDKLEPQKAAQLAQAAPPTPSTSHTVIEKAEERSIRRESWLLSQDSDHYTIQIMGVHNEGLLLDFIKKNQLLKQNEIAYYETTYKGKPWFHLLYGIFDTKKEAHLTANELPAKIKKALPWIRTISSVQITIQARRQSSGFDDQTEKSES